MNNAPILNEEELLAAVARERANGKTIAFANGIFDLLHVGHVRYLQAASAEGDVLVVAVNSDASTKMLKGEGRPLMHENERAEIVSAIRGVGYVTIFSDKSAARLIGLVRPDVHCKGTDYAADSVPEGEIVKTYGGRIAIVGDPKDHSTTEIIGRLRKP